MDLGFGKCNLQVQVPEKGDITDPKQLIGKNIVTSFTDLSEQYFRSLGDNGDKATSNGSGSKLKTNIKFVSGSVEAACALGLADGIVDLVGESCNDTEGTMHADDRQNQARPCVQQV